MTDLNTDDHLSIEHLFGDERPFSQCHAVSIAQIPNAGFLAAWFAGTHESHPDVGIWAATRGQSWAPPRLIAKVCDEPHWNPVLFALDRQDHGQSLVLHFKVGKSIRRWETWTQRSGDAGETWTEAVRLVDSPSEAKGGRGAVRAKPIRLRSGDWLAGASIERWRRWDAFFDRSPDGISDWQKTPLVPRNRRQFIGKGIIQPALWESAPGFVHALFRSTDGRVHRSDSDDDGRTWSPTRATALPNNNSGIDVVRLQDGCLALVCNPVPGNWAARTPLSVLFSRDNGATWPDRIDLETDPGEFSYPALIADGNESPTGEGLAVAYTWNRRRIAFSRIPADQIPRGESPS